MKQEKNTNQEITELNSLRKKVMELESRLKHQSSLEQNIMASLFHQLPDPLIVVNLQGTIIFINDAVVQNTGYFHHELIGKSYRFLSAEENTGQIIKKIYKCMCRFQPWEGELLQRRSDGNTYLAGFTVFPVFSQAGKTIAYAGIQRDRTTQKKAERTVQQQLHFFETLIDTIPHAVYYKDTEGIYQGCNRAFEKQVGYSQNELVGKTVLDIYPPDIAKECRAMDRALFNNPGTQTYEAPVPVNNTSGRIAMYNKATFKDANGNTAGLVGIITDITEQKHAEDRIRQERERLFSILDELPAFVYLQSVNYKIIFTNRSFRQRFGAVQKGKTCYEIIFGNKKPCANCQAMEVFKIKQSQVWEWEDIRGRAYEVHGYPFYDVDGSPLVLVLGLDITDRKQMENNLRASEEKYRYLVQHAPAGIYEIDFVKQRFTSVNDVMCDYLGYTREELLSMNPFDILTKESKRHFRQRLNKAFAGEKIPETTEFKVISKENREFWVLVNIGFIYESQTPARAAIVAHDITEHKELQAALSQQKRRLEEQLHFSNALNRIAETIIHNEDTTTVLDDTAAIIGQTLGVDRSLIYEIDFEKHHIKGVSEWLNHHAKGATSTRHTYNLDMFINAATYMLEQKEWLDSHADNVSPYAVKDGSGELLHKVLKIKSGLCFPFAFRDRGYYCFVINQVSHRRKWRAEEINFIHAAATQVEIAIQKIGIQREQRRAEKALRKSESLYRTIFENTGTATYIAGPDTVLSLVNTEFTNLSGYTKRELEGVKSWMSFVLKEDLETLNNYHHKRMLNPQKTPNKFEFRFVNKAGQIRHVMVTLAQIPGTLMHLASFLDITEIKHFQHEMSRLERLNLVGQMAAGIGHEVRNPMTTVRGFLQMFRGKTHLDVYKSHFDLMIDELDRANSIITQFLSLAKDRPVDKKICNLNYIIKELYPLIAADAFKFDMHVNLELQQIPNLLLDEKEIRQLILNLTRNGIEAMSPGKTITISTFTRQEKAVLAVKDQGTGIASHLMEKLGTPFLTTKDEGTGLGLSVCYSIATRHNAAIDVKTGPKGTTFFIEFNGR